MLRSITQQIHHKCEAKLVLCDPQLGQYILPQDSAGMGGLSVRGTVKHYAALSCWMCV